MDFVQFAQQKGLKLLKDDIKFLRARLRKIPKTKKRATMLHYIALWISGIEEEPINHKKQNKGRYKANYWLLTKAP